MKFMQKFMQKNTDISLKVLKYFFGFAFLVAGLFKILSFTMVKKGMFSPIFGSLGGVLLVLVIIVEVAGGLMLLIDWHAREASMALAIIILVALFTTFKLGNSMNFVGTLKEMLIMNTGGGNTPANFAYLAGLISIIFSGCKQCEVKK